MEEESPWLSAKKVKQTTLPVLKVARRIPSFSAKDLRRLDKKVQKPLEHFLKPKTMNKQVSVEKLNYSEYLLGSEKPISQDGIVERPKLKSPQGQLFEPLSEKSPFAVTIPLTDSSSSDAIIAAPERPSGNNMNDIRTMKRKYISCDGLEDDVENRNRCFECGKRSDGPCFSCVYKSSQFYETEQWRDNDIDNFDSARTHVSESVSSARTHVSESVSSGRTHVSETMESCRTHVSESIRV